MTVCVLHSMTACLLHSVTMCPLPCVTVCLLHSVADTDQAPLFRLNPPVSCIWLVRLNSLAFNIRSTPPPPPPLPLSPGATSVLVLAVPQSSSACESRDASLRHYLLSAAQESPTAGMSRSALQELARARGPKMQLFSSYSMPTLPVSKNAPFQSLVDSPFQSVVDNAQRHSDALEHAQQQMASIYKVVCFAAVVLCQLLFIIAHIVPGGAGQDSGLADLHEKKEKTDTASCGEG